MRKHGSCLEKELIHGTLSDGRLCGNPRTAWLANTTTWTGLSYQSTIFGKQKSDRNGEM